MTAGTRGIGVLERISRLSPSKFSGLRRASNLGPLDHSKSKYSFSGALPARYPNHSARNPIIHRHFPSHWLRFFALRRPNPQQTLQPFPPKLEVSTSF